jgi:hypothetical protein
MKYQLVLQFRGDSLADFDAMIALEEQLIEDLEDSADVDGHDCGSGETNIFIYTLDPTATFSKVKQTLEKEDRLESVTAAYRKEDSNHFTVLWPENSEKEFSLT